MSTFKEIDIDEYKKLLDNRNHTFAKTFRNVELLQNFEEYQSRNDINDIISEEKNLEKENEYIEKLSNKLSEKISNTNNTIVEQDKKKNIFLNPYQYYNQNPKIILNYIKNIYKSKYWL